MTATLSQEAPTVKCMQCLTAEIQAKVIILNIGISYNKYDVEIRGKKKAFVSGTNDPGKILSLKTVPGDLHYLFKAKLRCINALITKCMVSVMLK